MCTFHRRRRGCPGRAQGQRTVSTDSTAAQALFVGSAVGILNVVSIVMTVTVATPWGLHPVVGPSCVAAAASCWWADSGDAGTVPPPLFLLCGRVTRRRLISTTLCLYPHQVLVGRFLRISSGSPCARPLSAGALGSQLRGSSARPQRARHRHPHMLRRRSCTSGGTTCGLAAARCAEPRIVVRALKCGRITDVGYGGCCSGHG